MLLPLYRCLLCAPASVCASTWGAQLPILRCPPPCRFEPGSLRGLELTKYARPPGSATFSPALGFQACHHVWLLFVSGPPNGEASALAAEPLLQPFMLVLARVSPCSSGWPRTRDLPALPASTRTWDGLTLASPVSLTTGGSLPQAERALPARLPQAAQLMWIKTVSQQRTLFLFARLPTHVTTPGKPLFFVTQSWC